MGVPFKVVYCDKPSDVDHEGRNSLRGSIDYWVDTIRILDCGSPHQIFETIIHEVVHGIATRLCLSFNDEESTVERFANVLADTLVRNGFVQLEEGLIED